MTQIKVYQSYKNYQNLCVSAEVNSTLDDNYYTITAMTTTTSSYGLYGHDKYDKSNYFA